MVGSTKLVSAAAATVLALAPGALGRMVTKAPGSTHVYAAATPAPTDAEFTYTVALTPGNQDGLEDKMYEIALSGGSWLTEPQLLEYTKSKAEHVAAVKAHLLNHGAREQDIAEAKFGDALTVKSTVAAANSAWNTRLAHYTHTAQGHTILRATDSYTVPEELHDAITNVHPFTSFPNVRATIPISQRRPNEQRKRNERKAHKPDDQLCNPYSVEPRCLKWYYGADLFKPVPQEGENDILIFGFLGQYVSTSDLDDYVKTETDYPDYRIKIVNAGGSHNDPDNPGAEAALDVDMVAGIVAPLHATFLSYGSSNSSANEPFQEAFDWILNTYNDTNRPGVTTASYVDDASSYTQADAAHLCFTMQKLSSLGTTVLFGSGDNGLNGVQSFEDLKCTTKFNPTSPGSDCGFALIVSGTQLGDPVTNPEVVVDGNSPYGFFAGAGFSNHLARPKYQVRLNLLFPFPAKLTLKTLR